MSIVMGRYAAELVMYDPLGRRQSFLGRKSLK